MLWRKLRLWRRNIALAKSRVYDAEPLSVYWWFEYDRLWNARLGGDPDWTISGRLGGYRKKCRPCFWFCRLVLNPIFRLARGDKAHCQDTYEWHLVEHGKADERIIK